MQNINLMCAAGMSTSMLIMKMEKTAEDGYECQIQVYTVNEANSVIPDADNVLLGLQVRFNMENFRFQYPDKKTELIDMMLYGTMNGRVVFDLTKKTIH